MTTFGKPLGKLKVIVMVFLHTAVRKWYPDVTELSAIEK